MQQSLVNEETTSYNSTRIFLYWHFIYCW